MSDLIDRQAAIDAIDEISREVDDGDGFDYAKWREYFCELPSAQLEITLESAIDYLHKIGWMQEHDRILTESAQPKPQWIPVTERLPEHSERYLVSVLDGIDRRTTVAPYHSRSRTWSLTGRMAYWKVIAWMPLPEPYREGEKR